MEQYQQKIELLETSSDLIDNLLVRIEAAAALYHGGKEVEGSQKILTIIDDMTQLAQALTITIDVQKDPIDVSVLNDFLQESTEAFEHQDFVLLADLFEYEVSPVLEAWKEKILLTLGA
ncbi:hypothetical protein P4S95_11485 [Aneurinibacillus aneurinilyticus]|uniref:hypothetical protein n=1 Tax=Aneurinibacillus TaxID=55079 RepID=UPI002E23EBA4|nr:MULTISPECIES: hypothetical protein [Aneurinibacillus]MED0670821.1 hypothetical protein [Aneurinibacillus aneurinilyticus]MED4730235.1 hypothetical protein [Aneurinibacillus migulanus]